MLLFKDGCQENLSVHHVKIRFVGAADLLFRKSCDHLFSLSVFLLQTSETLLYVFLLLTAKQDTLRCMKTAVRSPGTLLASLSTAFASLVDFSAPFLTYHIAPGTGSHQARTIQL